MSATSSPHLESFISANFRHIFGHGVRSGFMKKKLEIKNLRIKLKGQLTFFGICARLCPNQDLSYHTTFSQLKSRVPVPLRLEPEKLDAVYTSQRLIIVRSAKRCRRCILG
jgi:hypothetical protein